MKDSQIIAALGQIALSLGLERADRLSLEELIDLLRLHVKAAMLDLEATKRENGYLRKMLDEIQKDEG